MVGVNEDANPVLLFPSLAPVNRDTILCSPRFSLVTPLFSF